MTSRDSSGLKLKATEKYNEIREVFPRFFRNYPYVVDVLKGNATMLHMAGKTLINFKLSNTL